MGSGGGSLSVQLRRAGCGEPRTRRKSNGASTALVSELSVPKGDTCHRGCHLSHTDIPTGTALSS